MDTTRDIYNKFNISNTLNLESIDSTMIFDMLTKTNISKAPGIEHFQALLLEMEQT